MATIITKNSATAGNTPSNLTQGELAINVADGRLFYGSGSSSVVKQFDTISTASYATNAGNASAIDIYSFSSPVDSYLLMSNVVGTTGVAIGGDADLRYNSSTNVLTVGNISATTLTGSLLGTASNAINAVTASYLIGSVTSASYASTASYINTLNQSLVVNGGLVVTSGSTASNTTIMQVQLANNAKQVEIATSNGHSVLTTYNSNQLPVNQIHSNSTTYFASSSLSRFIVGDSSGLSGKFGVKGDASDSSVNTYLINSNNTILLSALNNGNIGIGTISPSFPLDVVGPARFQNGITGSMVLTGSLTTTGIMSASSFNSVLSVFSQSRLLLDNTFNNTAETIATPNSIRNRSPLLRVYGTYTTASANAAYNNQIISTHLYPTFNPTNNTIAVFNTLVLEPQFLNTNATGSARGLYVTPGFSGAHPNWRSIEWDNIEGYGLYGSGTARNYLNGSLGIGTLTPSASLHTTGSGIIVGTLSVGTSSLGPNENTITLGARDAASEGGQIGFNAPGGTYTSASMVDLYQNRLRVLRGTNAGSDAEVAWWSMHSKQMALPAYNSATAFTGNEVAMLGVDSSGNVLTTTILGAVLTNNYIGAGFTNPIVTYMPFGAATVSGTESQRQVASPVAGSLKNFYLRTNNASPAGSVTTFIIRVNGVATNIKITISGSAAAGKFFDTTNSAIVAVGDDISLQVSTSVGNSPQVNQYSIGIIPS